MFSHLNIVSNSLGLELQLQGLTQTVNPNKDGLL